MTPTVEETLQPIGPLRKSPIGFYGENNYPHMPTSEIAVSGITHTSAESDLMKGCDDDGSNCERQGSQVSETSTEGCDLEPFETFQFKVQALCKKLWPKSKNVEIEKMVGGSYNRVVGITVHDYHEPHKTPRQVARRVKRAIREYLCSTSRGKPSRRLPTRRYVLRIPRFEDNRVDFDCAMLRFVSKNTSIPVPKIVAVDLTENNALGQRYVIQERVPGVTLSTIYGELNDSQKASVAREVGKVWLELQKKKYSRAGQLDPKTQKKILNRLLVLTHGHEPDQIKVAQEEADSSLNPIEWIFAMCERQKRATTMISSDCEPWDTLASIADKIDDDTDLLMQDGFYLCHGDFEARNMMVEVLDEQTVKITGILDWDLATFAPQLFGCQAPIWLWRWEELSEILNIDRAREDGLVDLDVRYVPSDPAKNAIKQAFEETVGPEFIGLSYSRDSDMLRRIVHCAIFGGFTPSSFLAIWRSIQYWLAEHHYGLGDELHEKIEFIQDMCRREDDEEELSNMEGVNRSENEWLMEY